MFRWPLVQHGLGHGSQAGHGLQVRSGGGGGGGREALVTGPGLQLGVVGFG